MKISSTILLLTSPATHTLPLPPPQKTQTSKTMNKIIQRSEIGIQGVNKQTYSSLIIQEN